MSILGWDNMRERRGSWGGEVGAWAWTDAVLNRINDEIQPE
jgi:hypothetical protein